MTILVTHASHEAMWHCSTWHILSDWHQNWKLLNILYYANPCINHLLVQVIKNPKFFCFREPIVSILFVGNQINMFKLKNHPYSFTTAKETCITLVRETYWSMARHTYFKRESSMRWYSLIVYIWLLHARRL